MGFGNGRTSSMVQFKKRFFSIALLLFAIFLTAPSVHARDKVFVGVAHFPPYIINEGGTVGGLAMEMLALMNAEQSNYEFVALPTLPTTRHKIFDLGRYDMSMFDNLDWGWKGRDVEASEVYLRGGEIYITRAEPGKDQTYFDSFKNKKMVGIEGYHYAFADFNSDPTYLTNNFNIELTRSNEGSIQMILAGRGDIAVVTKAYLGMYLNDHPEDREKLLLSTKYDQTYQHRIILRRNIKLTIAEINALLASLTQSGKLDALWARINLDDADKE
jgi:ABC-type amino acid transport substrate-binding protein